MADPNKPYQIGIKVSGGTASDVQIKLTNRRTKDYYISKTVSNEVVVNLLKLTSDGSGDYDMHTAWDDEDEIDIVVSGYRFGSTTHIVDATKGKVQITITLTDVSTTNAPAIAIG